MHGWNPKHQRLLHEQILLFELRIDLLDGNKDYVIVVLVLGHIVFQVLQGHCLVIIRVRRIDPAHRQAKVFIFLRLCNSLELLSTIIGPNFELLLPLIHVTQELVVLDHDIPVSLIGLGHRCLMTFQCHG